MFIRTRYIAAGFVVAAAFATLAFTQTNSANPGTVAGIWLGTATAGRQTAEVAFDIRALNEGLALYMTLPALHAWRMPVDFLKPAADGSWSIRVRLPLASAGAPRPHAIHRILPRRHACGVG